MAEQTVGIISLTPLLTLFQYVEECSKGHGWCLSLLFHVARANGKDRKGITEKGGKDIKIRKGYRNVKKGMRNKARKI